MTFSKVLTFTQVFADIIEVKDWKEFTIIYEGAELLPFLDNILTMQDLESGQKILINVVQLADGDDYRYKYCNKNLYRKNIIFT